MYNFNSKKTIYKKLLVMTGIFLILGFGLYIFDYNHEFMGSFKSYYAKSYAMAFVYKLKKHNLNDNKMIASTAGLLSNYNAVTEGGAAGQMSYAKSIPVLLYHGVIDKPDGDNVLIEDFKNQMLALKGDGWQTVSIEDFYKFMKGEKELPDKSFLLTFDDGRKDSYYPVDPILKALDYKAVMFVIAGRSIDDDKEISPFHLSLTELKKMAKSGRWDLQSHGKDDHDFYKIDMEGSEGHFLSNKLWLEDKGRIENEEEFKTRIYYDLVSSKNILEKEFGVKVISFAYPFGDYGHSSVNFPEAKFAILDVVKSVYPMSFYQVWGDYSKGNYPQPNAEHLFAKRINVEPEWNAENILSILEESIKDQDNHYDLLTILQNSREKILPYYDDFIKNRGWKKTWGNFDFRDEYMVIGSHASTTGSMIFLDGTDLWQNYIFKADVHFKKGQTYSIIAGYKDNSNYIFCSFTPTSIRLEQMIDGERKILNEFKGKFDLLDKEKNIGIGFSGRDASCYLDGKRVIDTSNALIDEKLDKGGVGFKTWDPEMNNSEMIIKNVSVEEII